MLVLFPLLDSKGPPGKESLGHVFSCPIAAGTSEVAVHELKKLGKLGHPQQQAWVIHSSIHSVEKLVGHLPHVRYLGSVERTKTHFLPNGAQSLVWERRRSVGSQLNMADARIRQTERPWEAEEPWTLAREAGENDVTCPWTHPFAGMGKEREGSDTGRQAPYGLALQQRARLRARVCTRPVEAAILAHTQHLPCIPT